MTYPVFTTMDEMILDLESWRASDGPVTPGYSYEELHDLTMLDPPVPADIVALLGKYRLAYLPLMLFECHKPSEIVSGVGWISGCFEDQSFRGFLNLVFVDGPFIAVSREPHDGQLYAIEQSVHFPEPVVLAPNFESFLLIAGRLTAWSSRLKVGLPFESKMSPHDAFMGTLNGLPGKSQEIWEGFPMMLLGEDDQ